jgi:replication-associated recombination protein RarA
MTGKQVDLSEQKVENEDLSIGREDAYLMKSALQKCIRQGLVEPAMYWALRLAEVSSWSVWRRLSIIAVEDWGDTDSILAVGELYRIFMAVGKQSKEKGLSWDGKCVWFVRLRFWQSQRKTVEAMNLLSLQMQ